MRLKRTTAIVLGLAAIAVMAPPAAPAVGQAGEIVSVAEREFEASGLGRKGLDLLMRKNALIIARCEVPTCLLARLRTGLPEVRPYQAQPSACLD